MFIAIVSNGIFRGTAKFSEEIVNKIIMTQLNVNPLLIIFTMYFTVVLYTRADDTWGPGGHVPPAHFFEKQTFKNP